MKRTALSDVHRALGAKMVEFAGYEMPIQYTSIRSEHLRVRTTVGVFDVSHMGEFFVTGPDREAFVDRMTINNVKALSVGQVHYSCMCKPHGGIVDDLLVYRFADRILLVVNGANVVKDWNWLVENRSGNVQLEDRTDEITLLAIQGRNAIDVIRPLTETALSEIKYYWFREGKVAGRPAIISRTGYTGEDGFELYVANDDAKTIWDALFESGKPFQIEPIGLGARDSLRLEMKMCLYGNDIDETTHPLEAGLGWITKLDKGEFVGRDKLIEYKQAGLTRKLVGLEAEGSVFPRHGYPLYHTENADEAVGHVTSGTVSPSLNKGIALGYVPMELTAVGSRLTMESRGRMVSMQVAKTPFYQRPY
ncbi:glycine cleavage system aminomethyltransferase GcvT [bacterium]|nr:glycine cleavage system aminomethyltransferase GcvT [bacterium]MBU1984726.1 glycine cleavage system aminomethyltransferase GcvT [bacterium]